MRRTVVVLALLALCLPAAAKDKWPDKWEIGFVSFQMERGILISGLQGHGLPLERLDCGYVTGGCLYTQPACTAMVIRKVKSRGKKTRIEICANAVNALSGQVLGTSKHGAACFTISGNWRATVAPTEDDCAVLVNTSPPVTSFAGGVEYRVEVQHVIASQPE